MASLHFNINNPVKVRLTDFGKRVLGKHQLMMHRPDEDGYSEFQLWDLMSIYGPHLFNGALSLPFEPTIKIDDEDLIV